MNAHYHHTLTSAGAAVGSAFCGVDAPAVDDSTAWVFGITSPGIYIQCKLQNTIVM